MSNNRLLWIFFFLPLYTCLLCIIHIFILFLLSFSCFARLHTRHADVTDARERVWFSSGSVTLCFYSWSNSFCSSSFNIIDCIMWLPSCPHLSFLFSHNDYAHFNIVWKVDISINDILCIFLLLYVCVLFSLFFSLFSWLSFFSGRI